MKAKQSLCITPSESQREVEPLPQLGRSLSSNCSPPSLPLNPYRGHSPAWLPAVEFCRYCPLRYRCSTFSSWARVSSTPQASSPAECSVALRGHLGSYISLPTPTHPNSGARALMTGGLGRGLPQNLLWEVMFLDCVPSWAILVPTLAGGSGDKVMGGSAHLWR